MKVGKQLLLPVLLILIFGVYLGVKSTGKINYKLPVFPSLKVDSIKSIEIINNNSTIKLYSDKGVWKFSSDNKRVNLGQIEQITDFLVTPNFTDMVSVSTNYQNFGLDNGEFIT
ncbi:MAG: hypothetical protein L3J12_07240, partial [Spirochaetales bacterium]|nr:hypothetical protein [Spirochaetales bacterium]